jgi:acyl transferase domain-containing protein
VSIAAVNGPRSVVISGRADAVEKVVRDLGRDGIVCQALPVSHAFHSALMEPALEDLRRVAAQIRYRKPRLPVVSTLTGNPVRPGEMETAEYWVRQAREAVQFEAALRQIRASGCDVLLELGPHPVLTTLGQPWLEGVTWVPTLRRGREDEITAAEAVAQLWVQGASIDWDRYGLRDGRRKLPGLPTYHWQRERHWFRSAPRPALPAPVPADVTQRHRRGRPSGSVIGHFSPAFEPTGLFERLIVRCWRVT